MIINKQYVLAFLLLASFPHMSTAKNNDATNTALVIVGTTAAIGGTYFCARGCGHLAFYIAQQRYAPEIDLLYRSRYKQGLLEEELVPYILRYHHDQWLYWHGKYKLFPLLKYKKDLDYYINVLSFLKFFTNFQTRQDITRFVDQLKEIRYCLVSDYRLIKEQREFENTTAVINK